MQKIGRHRQTLDIDCPYVRSVTIEVNATPSITTQDTKARPCMQHMYMHEHNVELKEEEEDEGKK